MTRRHDLPARFLAEFIEASSVQRMRHGADELARRIARQLRIRIQRNDVLHLRKDAGRADDERKTVRTTAAQQRVQVAKLATLALVAHPDPRLRIPASGAMKQIEHTGSSRKCLRRHRWCSRIPSLANARHARTFDSARLSAPRPTRGAARPRAAIPPARPENRSASQSAGVRRDWRGTGLRAPRPDPRRCARW